MIWPIPDLQILPKNKTVYKLLVGPQGIPIPPVFVHHEKPAPCEALWIFYTDSSGKGFGLGALLVFSALDLSGSESGEPHRLTKRKQWPRIEFVVFFLCMFEGILGISKQNPILCHGKSWLFFCMMFLNVFDESVWFWMFSNVVRYIPWCSLRCKCEVIAKGQDKMGFISSGTKIR